MVKNKPSKKQLELVRELDRWLRGLVNDDGKVDGHGSLGALADMRKAHHADVGTFILGVCFIDAMAGFRYGVTENLSGGVERRFKGFIKEYLPGYDPEDMYKSLRCGLVHNYVEHRGRYFIDSTDSSLSLHLKLEGGRVWINRERFIDDLEEAYKKFREHILKDEEVFANASARLSSLGLMRIRED